jgi:hypothetical protein
MFGELRLPNQERRPSARRGSGMRTLSGESSVMFGDWRIHNQERRASARRGSVTCRACRARRTMFGEHRLPNQERRASASLGSAIAPANTGRLLPNKDARMPRAAYVRRSCVGVRMSAGEIAICAMHKRTSAGAAGVSPPWFGNRTRSTERLLPNEDAHMPRGAYAPRSCIGVRMTAGEIAICAMHKRTSARAAAVSPPWFGNRTCNGDRCSWSGSHYIHDARSDGTPRLAYASRPDCTHANRRKCAAPLCTGDSFHNHGWLTPAAPGVRRRFAEKWRHSRCTNARSTRAATVSPPWFGNVTSLRTGNADRQPHPYVRLRAAGVTPPGYGNVSRLQSAARNVPRTPTAASRAAGVSPPWFGNGSRLRGTANNFRPITGAEPTSANRQPAVVRESHPQHRAFVAERGCSHATEGLRPPLLVVLRCGHSPAKLRLVRYTNARLQERRASARRGSVTAPATAIGFRGVITLITHDRMVPHGWLTPAAPGARRRSTEK